MKYSLDEIDFLRWATAVDEVLSHRPGCSTQFHANESYGVVFTKACAACLRARIEEQQVSRQNEEMLRTYMLNGTTPEELAKRFLAVVKDREYALTWPWELAAWYDIFKPLMTTASDAKNADEIRVSTS